MAGYGIICPKDVPYHLISQKSGNIEYHRDHCFYFNSNHFLENTT